MAEDQPYAEPLSRGDLAQQLLVELRAAQFELRDVQRRLDEVEERRESQRKLHDDVMELKDIVKELASVSKRCHEALFAENDHGEFQQLGIFRQWATNRRVFLALITIVPGVVSSAFALAFWMARNNQLP